MFSILPWCSVLVNYRYINADHSELRPKLTNNFKIIFFLAF